MGSKTRVPAVEGWFTLDDPPHLIGNRCTACGTVTFPPTAPACPDPRCLGGELEPTPLGRTGRVWSWTTNHYAPPEPYVAPDPFVPYTVVAVELSDERMIVLGPLDDGVDPATLALGQEMELTIKTLFTDDEHEHLVWAWRPA